MRLFLAVVLLMTMAFFSAARGEERIALVVANPAYEGSRTIANADLSAELVATTLRSLGFTVRQVSDGDRADVARAMHDFAQSLANPESVGVFYYVGHTAQANDRNYLLTRGTRIDSKETVDQTALPLDLFMQALEATPTLKVVLLDNPGDGHNPDARRDAGSGGGRSPHPRHRRPFRQAWKRCAGGNQPRHGVCRCTHGCAGQARRRHPHHPRLGQANHFRKDIR